VPQLADLLAFLMDGVMQFCLALLQVFECLEGGDGCHFAFF